jgi:Cu(I)-responsive transcriptional regulator
MTRGEVAERAGVGSETVRFYEQRGLIPPPPRTSSGYRCYDQAYVDRLRFVKRAQDLGFTLEEIKELLALRVRPDADSGAVRRRAQEKLADVEAKIRDLERIRAVLGHLVAACSGHGPTSECPILEALGSETAFERVNA